ncbi:MAG TPA: ice-binding family protein [Verrucomicrobiae bacterium]|nr:ice-binding family protein [Verrucomicrobiae bacterium]
MHLIHSSLLKKLAFLRRTVTGIVAAAAVAGFTHDMHGQVVDLGTAASFAVLAGSGITNTGPTTITGDIGTLPTPTITGLGSITLNGTNHAGDDTTFGAKADLTSAYADALLRTPTTIYGPIFDLGGLTLGAGVYNDPTSFGLTGTLTLDAMGDPNAVWIFQAGSTLITAANSAVVLTGGAQASNIFWQVGSSATLGTGTDFAGTILALQSITLTTGATIEGRALALNAAVTMDTNTITVVPVPEPSGALLLGLGLALLLAKRNGYSRVDRWSTRQRSLP